MFKERLKAVERTQTDLLLELKSRYGEKSLDPSLLSKVFRGTYEGSLADRVIKESEAIISEWEGGASV